ncbi:hypothetical protein M378DRAFT_14867 [Amanita muscaria Koide BX008]|uniref:Uncharacterized protein n=1 Tax=Amanita muscaria (strain Koide BX008) TaxID=946122 RepID=A0A0C2WSL7_AMAMK|nr:hypothetical protein M378DRAFT_14867 [Amanita muscaria Koide BX008]
MQGLIMKILNMRPQEVLGLVEEAAGTRMFEERRPVPAWEWSEGGKKRPCEGKRGKNSKKFLTSRHALQEKSKRQKKVKKRDAEIKKGGKLKFLEENVAELAKISGLQNEIEESYTEKKTQVDDLATSYNNIKESIF